MEINVEKCNSRTSYWSVRSTNELCALCARMRENEIRSQATSMRIQLMSYVHCALKDVKVTVENEMWQHVKTCHSAQCTVKTVNTVIVYTEVCKRIVAILFEMIFFPFFSNSNIRNCWLHEMNITYRCARLYM